MDSLSFEALEKQSLALGAGHVFHILMIRTFLLALLLGSPLQAVTIPHTEAGKHVGEEVTVTGKVTDVWTIESGISFVKFGTDPVTDTFSAVAKPEVLDRKALQAFKGKEVEVTGTVEIQNEKPKIILKTADSIRISSTAVAPEAAQTPEPAAPATFEIQALDVALERDEIELAGKSPSGFVPKSAEVVIAFPLDFKPAENQKVMVVVPEVSTETHLEKMVSNYAQPAAPKGWVTLTAHCPTTDEFPTPGLYPAVIQAAMRHLDEKYKGAKDWQFYLAGNSSGSGRATLAVGALMEEGFDVRGCYVSSFLREHLTKSIETYDPSRTAVKKLKVFISQGEADTLVTGEELRKFAEAIREAGVKNVRLESHSGRGGLDAAGFAQALDWFAEPE